MESSALLMIIIPIAIIIIVISFVLITTHDTKILDQEYESRMKKKISELDCVDIIAKFSKYKDTVLFKPNFWEDISKRLDECESK